MNVFFVSPIAFEKWDWRSRDQGGIGGSETFNIEMAWRLQARGHQVLTYTDLPKDCPGTWRGTTWRKTSEIDPRQEGLWVFVRCPERIDGSFKGRKWLVMQDVDYPSTWKENRIQFFDKIICLCPDHADHVRRVHPEATDRLVVCPNGVRVDLIRSLKDTGFPERKPKRLIYASSPDRGLRTLLKIFKRAKEYDPELELHVFYGFKNFDVLMGEHAWMARYKEDVLKGLEGEGVIWHGRISQRELYHAYLSSGLWVYPTEFTETGCISCMEAQALGAIPITTPLWALKQYVRSGEFIHGRAYTDPLVQARYVGEIIRFTRDTALQDRIRARMMIDAQLWYNWDRVVDMWESMMEDRPYKSTQYNFQHKHLADGGRVLNLGSQYDNSHLDERGALNVDIKRWDRVRVLADARALPFRQHRDFGAVILGDLLEHCTNGDIATILKECKALTNGPLIITWAEDHRSMEEQKAVDRVLGGSDGSYHLQPLTLDEVLHEVRKARLAPAIHERIDYTFCEGHGLVCL